MHHRKIWQGESISSYLARIMEETLPGHPVPDPVEFEARKTSDDPPTYEVLLNKEYHDGLLLVSFAITMSGEGRRMPEAPDPGSRSDEPYVSWMPRDSDTYWEYSWDFTGRRWVPEGVEERDLDADPPRPRHVTLEGLFDRVPSGTPATIALVDGKVFHGTLECVTTNVDNVINMWSLEFQADGTLYEVWEDEILSIESEKAAPRS